MKFNKLDELNRRSNKEGTTNTKLILIDDNEDISDKRKIRSESYRNSNNHNKSFNYEVIQAESRIDECAICLLPNIDSVIPCENKPKHKLHKYCLTQYMDSSYKFCPYCKSKLV